MLFSPRKKLHSEEEGYYPRFLLLTRWREKEPLGGGRSQDRPSQRPRQRSFLNAERLGEGSARTLPGARLWDGVGGPQAGVSVREEGREGWGQREYRECWSASQWAHLSENKTARHEASPSSQFPWPSDASSSRHQHCRRLRALCMRCPLTQGAYRLRGVDLKDGQLLGKARGVGTSPAQALPEGDLPQPHRRLHRQLSFRPTATRKPRSVTCRSRRV